MIPIYAHKDGKRNHENYRGTASNCAIGRWSKEKFGERSRILPKSESTWGRFVNCSSGELFDVGTFVGLQGEVKSVP